MNELAAHLQSMKSGGRKALSVFLTAGYPEPETTVPLAIGLSRAGVDLIELGFPFSDPVADGPVIQESSYRALTNGITIARTLGMVREIRKETAMPVVMMGYSNPVMTYGLERFLDDCRASGANGVILADLPLEESGEYLRMAAGRDLASIFLASPTTSDERLAALDQASTGFLYCVAVTGVTGERKGVSDLSNDFLGRVRRRVKINPTLAGFGISTPEDASRIAHLTDGIVIGSAMIRLIGSAAPALRVESAARFASEVRESLDRVAAYA